MVDRYRDRDFDDRWRDPRDRSREPYRSEYDDPRGRDFGWRGTELESGFAGGYGYDHSRDRVPAARDRDRYSAFDPDRFAPRDRDPGPRDRYPAPRDRYSAYERDRPAPPDRYRGVPDRDRFRDNERYSAPRDRYAGDDRYRYASGDPYLDRGYERDRDDRDIRFRDREPGADYWDDYPWSRYRGR